MFWMDTIHEDDRLLQYDNVYHPMNWTQRHDPLSSNSEIRNRICGNCCVSREQQLHSAKVEDEMEFVHCNRLNEVHRFNLLSQKQSRPLLGLEISEIWI